SYIHGPKFAVFPFYGTEIKPFFDFSGILEKTVFKLEIPDAVKEREEKLLSKEALLKNGEIISREHPHSFSSTELRVLLEAIRHPELPDNKAHTLVQMTPQVYSKLRQRLEYNRVFAHIYIPNLTKIGVSIAAVVHAVIKPAWKYRSVRENLFSLLDQLCPVIAIKNTDEVLAIFYERDYTSYIDSITKLNNYLIESNLLIKKPDFFCLNMNSLSIDVPFQWGHVVSTAVAEKMKKLEHIPLRG
ncbi:MAG: hypothetical protein QW728_05475, partial [Thermoplasmata archaeon]